MLWKTTSQKEWCCSGTGISPPPYIPFLRHYFRVLLCRCCFLPFRGNQTGGLNRKGDDTALNPASCSTLTLPSTKLSGASTPKATSYLTWSSVTSSIQTSVRASSTKMQSFYEGHLPRSYLSALGKHLSNEILKLTSSTCDSRSLSFSKEKWVYILRAMHIQPQVGCQMLTEHESCVAQVEHINAHQTEGISA